MDPGVVRAQPRDPGRIPRSQAPVILLRVRQGAGSAVRFQGQDVTGTVVQVARWALDQRLGPVSSQALEEDTSRAAQEADRMLLDLTKEFLGEFAPSAGVGPVESVPLRVGPRGELAAQSFGVPIVVARLASTELVSASQREAALNAVVRWTRGQAARFGMSRGCEVQWEAGAAPRSVAELREHLRPCVSAGASSQRTRAELKRRFHAYLTRHYGSYLLRMPPHGTVFPWGMGAVRAEAEDVLRWERGARQALDADATRVRFLGLRGFGRLRTPARSQTLRDAINAADTTEYRALLQRLASQDPSRSAAVVDRVVDWGGDLARQCRMRQSASPCSADALLQRWAEPSYGVVQQGDVWNAWDEHSDTLWILFSQEPRLAALFSPGGGIDRTLRSRLAWEDRRWMEAWTRYVLWKDFLRPLTLLEPRSQTWRGLFSQAFSARNFEGQSVDDLLESQPTASRLRGIAGFDVSAWQELLF